MNGWYCKLPEFFHESYPRAKKQYHCCECSAPILVGEKYGYYFGKWYGSVSTYRQHILCRDACVWIRDKFQSGECLSFGSLKEEYSEYTARWNIKTPDVKVLRHMMAEIIWRERKSMVIKVNWIGEV